jgi:hypothetical protein
MLQYYYCVDRVSHYTVLYWLAVGRTETVFSSTVETGLMSGAPCPQELVKVSRVSSS